MPATILLDAAALSESSADILMLSDALLLFSVSDSDAAVDAEADLLSLAAALALSLELALWLELLRSEAVESVMFWLEEALFRTASGAAAGVLF